MTTYVKNKYHFSGYVLLAIIIYFAVDVEAFIDQLSKISLSATIILIIVATRDRFTMAMKWMHLCSALNIMSSYFQFLKIYYVATFPGYCLPTSIGGEVYKAENYPDSKKS